MLYTFLKAVHLLGVVLLVGNVIVTLVWKLGADRTGEPSVIAFGQRLVTLTDWWFTLGGVALTLIGGFATLDRVGGLGHRAAPGRDLDHDCKPAEAPAEPAGPINRDKQQEIPRAWTVSTQAQLRLTRQAST